MAGFSPTALLFIVDFKEQLGDVGHSHVSYLQVITMYTVNSNQ